MGQGRFDSLQNPSRTTVRAQFQISPQQIQDIRSEVDRIGRKDFIFSTQVVGEQGEVIAEVEKLVYVRKRDFVFAAKKGDRRKGGERQAPRR